MTIRMSRPIAAGVLFAGLLACSVNTHAGRRPARPIDVPQSLHAGRIVCWLADGEGMQTMGALEDFLVDRLGANGDRIAVDPPTSHAVMRLLGLQNRSVFDPGAAHALANAVNARWVLWVKVVARDMQSKKLIGIPYLFNHRRLDAHVFFDVRLYDAELQTLLGSKRLSLSDRGEGTWQVTEDERLDPVYNNDPVEIHQRYRRLDWRAAALISGYCADAMRPQRLALMAETVAARAAQPVTRNQASDPVARTESKLK